MIVRVVVIVILTYKVNEKWVGSPTAVYYRKKVRFEYIVIEVG